MRVPAEKWKEARIKWEADASVSYSAVAEELGVSHVAVLGMAKRQNWVKAGQLASVNRAAQLRADAVAVTEEITKVTDQAADLTSPSVKTPLPASVELATDLRSKLIQSHRAEWRKHAALYPLDAIKVDFDVGKSAKISAEMLSIRQKGERAAWGLDNETSQPEIVIERSYERKPAN